MRLLVAALVVAVGATAYWLVDDRPNASGRAVRRDGPVASDDSAPVAHSPKHLRAEDEPDVAETKRLLTALATRVPTTHPTLLRNAPEIERLALELVRSDAAVELVLAKVRDPACPAVIVRVLMNLLGESGRAYAHAGLAEIMNRQEAAVARRSMALAALVRTRVLPIDLDVALIRLHTDRDSLGNAALSGLVSLYPRLDADGQMRVRRTIEESLEAGAEPDRLIPLLQAVGSLRGSDVPAAVPRALDDRDPHVRAAAAGALRWAQGDAPDAKLEAAARRDADANVRHTALVTLAARRRSGLQELLTDLAENDSSAVVRGAAAHLLETRKPGQAK